MIDIFLISMIDFALARKIIYDAQSCDHVKKLLTFAQLLNTAILVMINRI